MGIDLTQCWECGAYVDRDDEDRTSQHSKFHEYVDQMKEKLDELERRLDDLPSQEG